MRSLIVDSKAKMIAFIASAIFCLFMFPFVAQADNQSLYGDEDTDPSGVIDLNMDTTDASWRDSSGTHPADTFVITIPKTITLDDVATGSVDVSVSYYVNVRGGIGNGKSVSVTPNPSALTCDGDSVPMQITQGKTSWSQDDCVGNSGSSYLSGTSVTDTLRINGEVQKIGSYTGTISYTARLV